VTPRVVLEQAFGHTVLAALLYWWLGYAESGIPQLLISLLCVALLIAGTLALAIRARRLLGGETQPERIRILIAALLLPGALAITYFLIWWIPPFEGITAQAVSMAVRWGVAYVLVLFAWLNLLQKTARAKAGMSQV
jgi:hypothetical protein